MFRLPNEPRKRLASLSCVPNGWRGCTSSRSGGAKASLTELHDRALEIVRDLGSAQIHLWVLEENTRARRFYERRGWRENGETRVVPFPPNPLDVGYTLDF